MLRLMLFRHAKADHPADLVDHERPLSLTGHKQARKIGEHLKKHELSPDLVIVSSARRTQETWLEAYRTGGLPATKRDEPGIYEASVDTLLEVVRKQDPGIRTMMLIGHNPGMAQLTSWLVGSSRKTHLTRLQNGFVVGGLAVIDIPASNWKTIEEQSGYLERFETPDTV